MNDKGTIDNPLRVFSYGGGVQSNAVLVLQAMGKLANPFDLFVFANVGNDSENPATIEYVERYAKPFAEEHNITFIEVQKKRYGQPETVRQSVMRDNKSVTIPAFFWGKDGTPKRGARSCTLDFKGVQVDKVVKDFGASYAVIGIGFSTDEYHRVRTDFLQWRDVVNPRNPKSAKIGFTKKIEYPLIDLRLSRADCLKAIASAGLPPAPKSACYFCPLHNRESWMDLHRTSPDLFNDSVLIEEKIREKRDVYLTRFMKPLDEAINTDQDFMFDEGCDDGYCFV